MAALSLAARLATSSSLPTSSQPTPTSPETLTSSTRSSPNTAQCSPNGVVPASPNGAAGINSNSSSARTSVSIPSSPPNTSKSSGSSRSTGNSSGISRNISDRAKSGYSSSLVVKQETGANGKVVPLAEVNSLRSRLNKKLSEANTYNRFLLREIQYREEALRDAKAELVALTSSLKELTEEVSILALGNPNKPIQGKPMPVYVSDRLKEFGETLDKHVNGIESMRLREVPLVWFGMAEDVKVMGSFDGWTYGEQMSPEFTGTMTRFSTVLKLRPGTYEIKFKVDGEWRVAPEWPTTGHGMLENNVLVVE